jgi:hypothetical protein
MEFFFLKENCYYHIFFETPNFIKVPNFHTNAVENMT